MKELVIIQNKQAITTSLIVAEVFEKLHTHVLESIQNLECSEKFRESNFRLSSYQSKQNKTLTMYEITRQGAAQKGGQIAGDARKALELQTGKKVVSNLSFLPENRKNYFK